MAALLYQGGYIFFVWSPLLLFTTHLEQGAAGKERSSLIWSSASKGNALLRVHAVDVEYTEMFSMGSGQVVPFTIRTSSSRV